MNFNCDVQQVINLTSTINTSNYISTSEQSVIAGETKVLKFGIQKMYVVKMSNDYVYTSRLLLTSLFLKLECIMYIARNYLDMILVVSTCRVRYATRLQY
jgi:hypothetical protein